MLHIQTIVPWFSQYSVDTVYHVTYVWEFTHTAQELNAIIKKTNLPNPVPTADGLISWRPPETAPINKASLTFLTGTHQTHCNQCKHHATTVNVKGYISPGKMQLDHPSRRLPTRLSRLVRAGARFLFLDLQLELLSRLSSFKRSRCVGPSTSIRLAWNLAQSAWPVFRKKMEPATRNKAVPTSFLLKGWGDGPLRLWARSRVQT